MARIGFTLAHTGNLLVMGVTGNRPGHGGTISREWGSPRPGARSSEKDEDGPEDDQEPLAVLRGKQSGRLSPSTVHDLTSHGNRSAVRSRRIALQRLRLARHRASHATIVDQCEWPWAGGPAGPPGPRMPWPMAPGPPIERIW